MKIVDLTLGDRQKSTYVIVMVSNEETQLWIETIVSAYCEACCVPQHTELCYTVLYLNGRGIGLHRGE